MKRLLMAAFIVLSTAVSAFSGNSNPLIREQHEIVVNGVEEQWRLEWLSPPSPACAPDDNSWYTCPCNGFAFGEQGKLILLRDRPSQKEETLELYKVFGNAGDYDAPVEETGGAVLRRWDVHKEDDFSADAKLLRRVQARPLSKVMNFGDYDHTGWETEFLFQVGTEPCGKKMSVAVGISRANPHLHVLTSAEHPERLLILQNAEWESLRLAKKHVQEIDWLCGDHASDSEIKLEMWADKYGIHVTRREYECTKSGQPGKLISEEAL